MAARICPQCETLLENGERCTCRRSYTRGASIKTQSTSERGYGYEWQKIRRKVLERDHYTCQLGFVGCEIRATTVDHVIPLSKGGDMSMDNLVAACKHCNYSKGGTLRAW